MKSTAQKREELTHKTFLMMFRVLVIFGIPAAAGYFIGKWIDTTYDIRPYGTLGTLAVTFTFSWALVIRMYMKLTKEFAALRAEEEAEVAEAQANIQKTHNQNT